MDHHGNILCEQLGAPIGKQSSAGLRVRDMIRRYDIAVKSSDGTKSSFSSLSNSKSSYFGLNANEPCEDEEMNDVNDAVSPQRSSSRSSRDSLKTVRNSKPSTIQDPSDTSLMTQKSFMNLSRSREPPKAAPREKKARNSNSMSLQNEEKINIADSSYPSKTTISKTPKGVRIIVEIFFDQNQGIGIEDVVGSRIETDIPPSKILAEFQRRVAESSGY